MSEKAKLMMEKLKLYNSSEANDVSSFLPETQFAFAARSAANLLHVFLIPKNSIIIMGFFLVT